MSEKDISTIDVESEGGIAEAFEIAAKQGVAEINLKIPVPHGIMETHGDAIDRLRARGTPIELIGSYITAEKWDDVRSAFRCSVLELAYERLAEMFEADMQFLSSSNLHRQEENDTLCMIIDKDRDQTLMQFSFGPEADSIPTEADQPRAKLPVGKIESGVDDIEINDDINATVISTIDTIVTNLTNIVMERLKTVPKITYHSTAKTHLYIIPDLSVVEYDHANKKAWAYIAICGFRG